MKKISIITGYTCNNNCVFCYDSEKRENGIRDLSTYRIKKILDTARDDGCDYVDFLGGEFTIRGDALGLVSHAKELGFKTIATTTNGRAFSYKELMQTFVDAGVNSIIFSIHGHTAELHDSQTQVSGSFRQLLSAVENAKQMNIPLSTNTTITKKNIRQLPETGRFLYNLGSRNAEFIFLDPTTGKGNTDFDELMPGITKSAPYIRKLLDIGKQNKIPHWHIRYYPMCHLKGYEDFISELHEKEAFSDEIHVGPEFVNTKIRKSRKAIAKTKAAQCRTCIYDDVCEGVWKKYAETVGTDELRPVH